MPLDGAPGTPKFLRSYQAGLRAAPEKIGKKPAAGTISALAVSLYGNWRYTQLSAKTQASYRRVIERLRGEHGHDPVRLLETKHIRAMLSKKSATPASANDTLRVIRLMMAHAVEEEWRKDDPSTSVRKLREAGTGIPTWTEEDIAAFEARWPLGTRAGLALALLLYTGQRRSDAVRMGRQHMRGGGIDVRQMKTSAEVFIPIHHDLQRHIDLIPPGQLTLLVTVTGRPYSPSGLTDAFRDWIGEAGIPAGRTPHGLRKAQARRLAEAGCTAHQIASITGHKTLSEVQRYTKAVDQQRLAQAAILRLPRDASGTRNG